MSKITQHSVVREYDININYRQLNEPKSNCIGFVEVEQLSRYGSTTCEANIYLNKDKEGNAFFHMWTDQYNNVIKAVEGNETPTFKMSHDLQTRIIRWLKAHYGNDLPKIPVKTKKAEPKEDSTSTEAPADNKSDILF